VIAALSHHQSKQIRDLIPILNQAWMHTYRVEKAIPGEQVSTPVHDLPPPRLQHYLAVVLLFRPLLIVGTAQHLDIGEPVYKTDPRRKKQEDQ